MDMSLSTHVRLREPGLGQDWIGQERHPLKAGGVMALPLLPGDQVEVVDPEGLQSAQVFAFNSKGQPMTESLGVKAGISGAALARMLEAPFGGARKIREKLKLFSIDLAACPVAELMSGETHANHSTSLVSQDELIALFSAPGVPMKVDQSRPPTDLVVFVKRANPAMLTVNELPDPLADEIDSIHIEAATAKAYEVREGEYIQIIDVDGRQCSDFQCFDMRALDQGRTRNLSATTTRSLMGNAYPTPGLYSKFYDIDFNPLVEVVQDTCGRHDSFGVACTSKYYDEAGYPGHVNCSDNFNAALAPYPIEPRKGWQAMNLFFNTFFDEAYSFTFDDPWSRPGDYVLMRAMTDLVCLSSSCPCDIDPANAWVPTDIHVRLYGKQNLFKRSLAYRKTTDAEPEMTQETSFHSRTSALTRNFIEYNGYWLANSFNNLGAISEYWACRETVVMTDLSPLRKYEVTGPDAEILLQACVTRDVRRLAIGQVVYTAMCYESGGMIDDGTVFRLAQHNFRWIGGNDASGLWLREQAHHLGLRAWVKDSTSQLHNLQVQGPRSLDTLKKCIWTRPDQSEVSELGWFRFSIARIEGADGVPIICSRTGYTGELGYEIFCHPRDSQAVWDAIWQAGQEYGIAPLGLEALDMLRIEAGLVFAGQEFCDQTDPFEAGIGFTVSLKTKQDNFIGREELMRRKANPYQKLVGLELEGEESAVSGDGVFIGREQVGSITSAMISPILAKNIALCRIKSMHADLGSQLEVGKLDGHQKRIPAQIVRFPHFDPDKQRVRGNYLSSPAT